MRGPPPLSKKRLMRKGSNQRTLRTLLTIIILIAACSPLPSLAGTVHCTECGMMVDMNSKFTAKIVQGDMARYFCDIGDLFSYLKRKGAKDGRAEVRDYVTGEWLDANKAFYVHAEKKFKTPMGWGIAAFQDRKLAAASGSVMDFDGMAHALR